ncbi:phosphatase PAP2 family protein [Pseudonocardia sp. T1-2H]|uniref:phosphatase PAP2 family protein n=1 Tax=Pseudonocardia sp. T1-2H TaxID=3128899 RepID=UPI0031019DB2
MDAVADPDGISAADVPLLHWTVANRSLAATAPALAGTTLGGTTGMAVLATVAAVVLWLRRRRWEAGVVIVTAAGAGVLVETLKNFYDRVLGILAAVAVVVLLDRTARTVAVVLAATLVVAIGLSRLYLGAHWLTDVLDGWLVGATWLALCVTLLLHRRPVPLPAPDPALPDPARPAGPVSEVTADPSPVGFNLDPDGGGRHTAEPPRPHHHGPERPDDTR